MTTAIAGVRAHLASTLASITGVTVYANPDGPLQPPCIALLPGSPYRDNGTAWDSCTVGIDVRIVVPDGVGFGAMTSMDALIDATCDALTAAQVLVGSVPAPVQEPEQAVLVCDVPTSTVWKDD